jgi:hypothetical protein
MPAQVKKASSSRWSCSGLFASMAALASDGEMRCAGSSASCKGLSFDCLMYVLLHMPETARHLILF